jgi:serine/threonine protein phosphatase PrpC
MFSLQAFGLTHRGKVRPSNEDRFLIRELRQDTLLLAVMDGLGGQAGGEMAAEMAGDILASFSFQPEAGAGQMAGAVDRINKAIMQVEEEQPHLYGLGCTLTAALVIEATVHWIHVGDSRLYHLNRDGLQQITKDHNLAEYFFEEGELSHEEMRTSPMRNMLEQSLGGSFMQADSGSFLLRPGDMLLLCTDGVHGELPSEELSGLVDPDREVEEVAQALIDAALTAGGRDNITAVVMKP